MGSGRLSLSALRARTRSVQERTLEVHREVVEKKAKRRARVAADPPVQQRIPNFDLVPQLTNGGQEPERVVTSNDVREWFRAELVNSYGDKLTLPPEKEWWTLKERSLAKKLLNSYGRDLVQRALAHLCDNWDRWVAESEGRLSGIPTIGYLWTFRERIFAAVQGINPSKPVRKRKKKDFGEYQPSAEPAVGIGWEK